MKRGIPVIPILLEGTRIPKRDELPIGLKELALRNGLNVRHVSFLDDMERLIRGLKRAQSPQQLERTALLLADKLPQQPAEEEAQRKAAEEAEARRKAEEYRSRQKAEAKRKEDQDQAFAAVKRADLLGAINAFLTKHPESSHTAEARLLREALEAREKARAAAMAGENAAVLKAFLRTYPDGSPAKQVALAYEALSHKSGHSDVVPL